MKKIILILALQITCMSAKAQEKPKNILPLWTLERVKALNAEANKNCLQYQTTDIVAQEAKFCERIQIFELKSSAASNYTLLSQVTVKNKCNPDFVNQAATFDIATFNPLCYFFVVKENETKWFKVDNSNYYIQINAKK